MTKLIIFDLDGVLVEAKQIHYDTLNQALKEIDEKYVITEAEHLSIYDGLKTTQKLELLTKNKGLHPEFYDDIWYRKQYLTIEAISQLQPGELNLENDGANAYDFFGQFGIEDRDLEQKLKDMAEEISDSFGGNFANSQDHD